KVDAISARRPRHQYLIPPQLAGAWEYARCDVFEPFEQTLGASAAQEYYVAGRWIQQEKVLEQLTRVNAQSVLLIQQACHDTDRAGSVHCTALLSRVVLRHVNGRGVASSRSPPPCVRRCSGSWRDRN